jgi:DNA-binding NarL/FixJ family response regulator
MAQLNCTAGVFAAPIERTAELQRDAPIAVPARREVQSQYPAGEVPTPLTPREVQVLKLVAEGYRTKEIAPLLNITLKTVVSHKSHIMEKLNIHDAVGLTRYAIRRGISSAGIVREQVPA